MAYKVIILYQLYMPSYFLGTFTEYPYLYKQAKQSRPIPPTRYIYFISYPKGISLERLSPCTIKRTTKLLTEINKINNPIQLINRIPTIPAPVLKSKSAKVDK